MLFSPLKSSAALFAIASWMLLNAEKLVLGILSSLDDYCNRSKKHTFFFKKKGQ